MYIDDYTDNSIKTWKSSLSPYYGETKLLLLEFSKEFVK